MGRDELEKSILDWKQTVEDNLLYDSVGSFAESTVYASPIIDKASTWVAAGTATVAGLAITNIESMTSAYSGNDIKCLFSTLAASLFFAVLQKFLSVLCSTALEVGARIRSTLPAVIETFSEHEQKIKEMSEKHELEITADFDYRSILTEYIQLYPRWVLWLLKRQFRLALSDRCHAYRIMISRFVGQNICALLQFTLVLVFIALSAVLLD